ncbi:cob(I)alamin adenosyltransferase [Acrasis kona]|uniref:Corrinoid adenosyltransferase MMAB n=1 Tax=Acrasis kona TaxID=1008807 RepID=A0AAW2YTD8_9EUKA
MKSSTSFVRVGLLYNMLCATFNRSGRTLLLSSNFIYRRMTSISADEDHVKKSMIYTRTGDKGTSSLFNGKRVKKDDLVFEALGSVDELNAQIGLAREYGLQVNNGLEEMLSIIQSRLLDVGASVATPIDNSSEAKLARVHFDESNVDQLEKWIDEMDHRLPALKNFILPSGGLASSQLHVARTVCRTAERRVVPLVREDHVQDVIQRYLNRLSDYLFVAARTAAAHENKPEVTYKKTVTK